MKNWERAEVEVMDLANTAYGGQVSPNFDDIFVNDEGNYEGTFVPNSQS